MQSLFCFRKSTPFVPETHYYINLDKNVIILRECDWMHHIREKGG